MEPLQEYDSTTPEKTLALDTFHGPRLRERFSGLWDVNTDNELQPPHFALLLMDACSARRTAGTAVSVLLCSLSHFA